MIIRGVDTLEFGLDIENYELCMRPFLNELKELKEAGQQTSRLSTLKLWVKSF